MIFGVTCNGSEYRLTPFVWRCRCTDSTERMAESHADLDQLPERICPEGAGGEEADLHNHVPDNIFRMAERPGPLRDALEARAAASKYSVQTIFSRLLAHCFIR